MRALKTIVAIAMLALFVAACGSGENDVGTLVPTVATSGVDRDLSDESPRTDTDEPDTTSSVPPTWTPMPTAKAPPPPATPAPDETYVVQAGDTLAELAEQFGVDLQVLVRANDIQNIDHIEVGQVLTIPR